MSDLLLDGAAQILPSLDPQVRGLLAHDGLLGDALLWFLRERLRTDPRVNATLDALQREGLWADVRDLKAAQAGDGPFLHLAADSQALGPLVDARLTDLTGLLTELGQKLDATLAAAQGAQAGVQAVRIQLDGLGGQLQDDLLGLRMGLGAQLDALPQAIVAAMLRILGPGNLGIRVTPGDEFTHHDGAARGLILQAQAELARLAPGPGYTVAALAVGSALSSTGAAAGAEALFLRAAESAETVPERALAAYNLFQARLRQGPTRYPEALAALRQAVDLEPDRYATHEEWKYPTQAILGAGGMGCAFLCREPVEGNRPVVVKTFWRAVPGAVQETFAEAMTMNRVGGGHVPALRGYGFAPGGRRPYIVMDYLDGYRDGEAWLAEHGPLPLAQGLALGRRVLEALAAAHTAGVVHLDLKPANLLLKAERDSIEVKVIDFGLARVAERVDGARAAGASRSGLSVLASSIAGTWDYAPSEQMGQTQYGPPGPRSDLYAFGATWYRLMSGRHPGNRRTKHLPSGCPEALFELIQDLMEYDPKDRPGSAEAVMRALEGIAKPVGAAFSRDVPPAVEPARTAPAPRPVAPATRTAPEVPDIHGWSTAQVQSLQKAAAEALGRPVVFRDRLQSGGEGPELVVIPAGPFLMGSPDSEEERRREEGPQHQVTISRPFALGRYAVTFDEYDAFCADSDREQPGDEGWGRGSRPVINVSWNDAVAYCAWLSGQTGQAYRLPSEAEWEYACRAGTATPFSTGTCLSTDQANYDGNHPYSGCPKGQYREETVEVGSLKAPNPWGLHDMHGNVWEWVQDSWHDSYRRAPDGGSAWEGGRLVLCCAVARGSTSGPSPAPPPASGSSRSTAASTSACGWPVGFRPGLHDPLPSCPVTLCCPSRLGAPASGRPLGSPASRRASDGGDLHKRSAVLGSGWGSLDLGFVGLWVGLGSHTPGGTPGNPVAGRRPAPPSCRRPQ